MRQIVSRFPGVVAFLTLALLQPQASRAALTVRVGGEPLPAVPLVSHGDPWRYRLGSNAPPAGWQTSADAALDASWLSGPGGFGYSDNDDATVLTVLSNRFSTLYTRRSFEITGPVDPSRRLELIVDYDDGYVVWLDGVQVARSSNITNAPGVEPAFNATSDPNNNHEALGYQGLPVPVLDLGAASALLAPGTHVLAVMGLNGAANSSDFSLIVDLRLSAGQGETLAGEFLALVKTNLTTLSGTNTVPGATRVTVNGAEATVSLAGGTWSRLQGLLPGMNRLTVAALDDAGHLLGSTNQDIVCEFGTTTLGGLVTTNLAWTNPATTIRVTNDLVVADGATLSIGPGVVVLLSPTASLRARTNGLVEVAGADDNPACFLPADGTTTWGELSAGGVGSSLTLRQAEVVNGQVIAHAGSTVAVEDCLLRDFRAGSRLFLTATNATQFTLRRSQIVRYDQVRFESSPVLIEDCLFERIGSDATDFSNHSNIQVRRTTYRFGAGSNTDALDLGNNPGMLIENCLIHDLPDKGISVANSSGVVVRNSLIYNVGIGIATYASSDCLYKQNTIADSTAGLSLYTRAGFTGPGSALATNNIIWGSTTNIHLADGGTLSLAYSDVQGATWPGPGNLSADPLFVSAVAHDYRLRPGSPATAAGSGGVDMGVIFPVGGIPPAPFNLAALTQPGAPIALEWAEDADNETGFEIQRSSDGLVWQSLGTVIPNWTTYTDHASVLGQSYFYRVRAVNSSGHSRWSNPAGGARRDLITVVGGTLTSNTVWSPAMGIVLVLSDVIVPTNVTLQMAPGTRVVLTNSTVIRALDGGNLSILGSETDPVTLAGTADTNSWRELSARGQGSSLTIRFADISRMQTTVYSNAVALIEDSYFHDYYAGSDIFTKPLFLTHFAAPSTVRRCHFQVLLRDPLAPQPHDRRVLSLREHGGRCAGLRLRPHRNHPAPVHLPPRGPDQRGRGGRWQRRGQHLPRRRRRKLPHVGLSLRQGGLHRRKRRGRHCAQLSHARPRPRSAGQRRQHRLALQQHDCSNRDRHSRL